MARSGLLSKASDELHLFSLIQSLLCSKIRAISSSFAHTHTHMPGTLPHGWPVGLVASGLSVFVPVCPKDKIYSRGAS